MDQLRLSTTDGQVVQGLGEELRALARAIAGELIGPAHPHYDRHRRLWNGLIDKRPGLIVRCVAEADVVHAVTFGRDNGIEVAVRGGGHNVAGRAVSDGGMVIDLSLMRRVELSSNGRRVIAQGGATLGDVDRLTLPYGLSVPMGLVTETGLAGLTLHGGYGWQTRRHGLACDNLVGARVVLADGRVLHVSEHEEPELFWALRGGGGNFGVVTSLELRTHPIAPEVWFSLVIHPAEDADRVLANYRDVMSRASDDLGAIALFWSAPKLPQLETRLHGTPVVITASVHFGDEGEGARELAGLRNVGAPLADVTSRVPFATVQKAFDADYPRGRLYYWKSAYLKQLSDGVISTLKNRAATRPSALTSVDLWALGGAAGRVPLDATAFSQRGTPYLLAVESNWNAQEATRENIEWTRAAVEEVRPYASGERYLNFAGFGEEGAELVRSAYGNNLDRLQAVKRAYDPDNLFRGNFNIAP